MFDVFPLFVTDQVVFIIMIFGLQMTANLCARILRKPKFASQESYEFLDEDVNAGSGYSADSFERADNPVF